MASKGPRASRHGVLSLKAEQNPRDQASAGASQPTKHCAAGILLPKSHKAQLLGLFLRGFACRSG